MMYVKYNGGTQSYYTCTSPENLVCGRIYKVVEERDRGWQTDYTLEGVEGQFNSVWFDEMPTYLAIAKMKPEVGHVLQIARIEVFHKENGKTSAGPHVVYTTQVREVQKLGPNMYLVVTANTVYSVQVMKF